MPKPLPLLSDEQQAAAQQVRDFIAAGADGARVITMHGLAGTGKTVVLSTIANEYPGTWLSALSGKACDVLRKKTGLPTATLHSTFYKLKKEAKTAEGKARLEWSAAQEEGDLYGRVILLDECSMVDTTIANDILRTGARIVACGDPGQLPPVSGNQFFTKPDIELKRIHRQALDSPIIRQAHFVRFGKGYREDGDAFRVVSKLPRQETLAADTVLCWTNKTRQGVNALLRRLKGIDNPYPQPGEPVICLKNAPDYGIFNGGVYTLTRQFSDGDSDIWIDIPELGETRIERVNFENMTSGVAAWDEVTTRFDFAYCLTVHKAQGSEWPHVVLIDEYSMTDQRERWVYTAVTRAAERITVVRR